MKIVTFQGGLGNQMFQYQFYLWLQKQTDDKIFGYYPSKGLRNHNGLEIEQCFSDVILPTSNLFIDFYVKFLKLLNKTKIKNTISSKDNYDINKIIFEDYWLDLKYLSKFRFELKEELLVKNAQNIELLNNINRINSVSVHIRRNDYLNEKYSKIYDGICNANYYNAAVDYVFAKDKNVVFYVFSDEIDWCKEKMNIPNAIFVDCNKGKDSILDLYLMSRCKTNIIANSTFSWWAAYNNQNAHKTIIAPKRWFNENTFKEPDIFPENWIRL
ncbi:MAG: alpha-1,2-fucosyltransferase [Paludibacter sp.]|nr:alpha-1,2-fucosyltransferase [Paludibacter sp.]